MRKCCKHIFIFVFLSTILNFSKGFSNEGSSDSVSNDVYQSKDYSYLLGDRSGLHDSLLKMHFTLYQGYVTNSNKLLKILKTMQKNGDDRSLAFGALKRRFGWEFDGMLLHELYFSNLGGRAALSKKSMLYQKIVENFGNYLNFISDFKSTGLIRGIGWVILYLDPISKGLDIVWINEHDTGHLADGNALLVMDVWEHAYLTEFGLDRGKYIDVFLKDVDWTVVEKRLKDRLVQMEKNKKNDMLNNNKG